MQLKRRDFFPTEIVMNTFMEDHISHPTKLFKSPSQTHTEVLLKNSRCLLAGMIYLLTQSWHLLRKISLKNFSQMSNQIVVLCTP